MFIYVLLYRRLIYLRGIFWYTISPRNTSLKHDELTYAQIGWRWTVRTMAKDFFLKVRFVRVPVADKLSHFCKTRQSLMKNVNNYLGAHSTAQTHLFYPSLWEHLSSLPRSGMVALWRLFARLNQHTLQVFCIFQKSPVKCLSVYRDLASCTCYCSLGPGKLHERSSSLVERELSNVQYLNRSNGRILPIQQTFMVVL